MELLKNIFDYLFYIVGIILCLIVLYAILSTILEYLIYFISTKKRFEKDIKKIEKDVDETLLMIEKLNEKEKKEKEK